MHTHTHTHTHEAHAYEAHTNAHIEAPVAKGAFFLSCCPFAYTHACAHR